MQTSPSLTHILRAAVLAALLAASITAGFHSFATEPLIDKAIALEEAGMAAGATADEEPMVSRPAQKVGLVLGYALYALTLGLLFTAAYHGGRRLLAPRGEQVRALWLSATAYLSLGLLPMLKYPASPPGMGDPATIDARQAAYLTLLALGVVVGGVSLLATRLAGRNLGAGAAAALAVLFAGGALLFVGLPTATEEATVPAELLASFRTMSLLGVTLFWLVFAAGFTWLITQRPQRQRVTAPSPA